MRVLLIGEFSSLHRYLKEGLNKLGHEVVLVSNRDGTKNIPGTDYVLHKSSKNIFLNYYYAYVQSIIVSRRFKNFDVVQFISTRLYPCKIRKFIYKKLLKHNKRVFYSASGGDYAMKLAYDQKMISYFMYDKDELFLQQYSLENKEGRFNISFEQSFLKEIDGIIPSLFEYSIGYKNSFKNLQNAIPFPINTDDISYSENVVNNKVVFFHGITRENNKGTSLIKDAFNRLLKNFPDKVEIIIKERMPFNEYIKVIDKANVIVDQCKSYGYGINACISMAKGKVVMTGCRKEEFECLNIKEEDNPMILTKPDVDFLYKQMEWIVQNSEQIPLMGKKSREYVEKYHNYVKIAKRYIELWSI